MSENIENQTLRLLRELLNDVQELRGDVHELRDDLTTRIDGNTLILNMLTGYVSQHEERVTDLEDKIN